MLLEPSSHFGKHVGQRVSRQSVNASADTSARLHLYSLNLLSWSLTFSNFFLLPTERRNKIRVRQGKFFDECIGSVSADVSVVCRWCVNRRVGRRVYRRVGGIRFFTFTGFPPSSKTNISKFQFDQGIRGPWVYQLKTVVCHPR